MAPFRSLGNALSSFRDFYAVTGGSGPDAGGGPSPISASGGNQTTATGFTNGGYKYHVFTSSGALTTSHYQYAGAGFNSSTGGSNWGNNALDYIKLLGETIRHDSGMSAALRLFISNPSGTSNQKRCF